MKGGEETHVGGSLFHSPKSFDNILMPRRIASVLGMLNREQYSVKIEKSRSSIRILKVWFLGLSDLGLPAFFILHRPFSVLSTYNNYYILVGQNVNNFLLKTLK